MKKRFPSTDCGFMLTALLLATVASVDARKKAEPSPESTETIRLQYWSQAPCTQFESEKCNYLVVSGHFDLQDRITHLPIVCEKTAVQSRVTAQTETQITLEAIALGESAVNCVAQFAGQISNAVTMPATQKEPILFNARQLSARRSDNELEITAEGLFLNRADRVTLSCDSSSSVRGRVNSTDAQKWTATFSTKALSRDSGFYRCVLNLTYQGRSISSDSFDVSLR